MLRAPNPRRLDSVAVDRGEQQSLSLLQGGNLVPQVFLVCFAHIFFIGWRAPVSRGAIYIILLPNRSAPDAFAQFTSQCEGHYPNTDLIPAWCKAPETALPPRLKANRCYRSFAAIGYKRAALGK